MPADKAPFPNPAVDVKSAPGKQTAVLAGGCFWCTEAVFKIMEGVDEVISGYSGGTKETYIVNVSDPKVEKPEKCIPAAFARNEASCYAYQI